MSSKPILSRKEIKELRDSPENITPELISELRALGIPGKDAALSLLDMDKDPEKYYLDAFGGRITFLGNRGLKSAFTQHQLTPLHEEEIQRCQEDIHYFKDNYVKIVTPTGVTFPSTRHYQDDFLSVVSGDASDIACLLPRQSGKSVSTQIYLQWVYVFMKNINVGICANRGSSAREFLSKTKQIIINLPIWLQPGTEVWNKTSITSDTGVNMLTDVPSSDAFRGHSIHCLSGESRTTVFDTVEGKYKNITMKELYESCE